jgi:hypothetical protein
LPKLAAALDRVPSNHELHVHFERLNYIDHACLDLLVNWEKQHQATGGGLVIDWDSLAAKFHGRASGIARTPRDRETTSDSAAEMPGKRSRHRQPALSAAQEDC